MHSYNFQAQFLSLLFNTSTLEPAVIAAVKAFNGLNRKNYKNLEVIVNPTNSSLEFKLVSCLKIHPINYLRASQYFSKQLSLQLNMSS